MAFQLERDRRSFVLAVEDELDAEIEADGQRIWFRDRVSTVTAVPIGVDYDRIQGVGGDPALVAEQQRLREAFGLERRGFSAWASIGSTTRRASPSGWKRWIASSPAGPSFADG